MLALMHVNRAGRRLCELYVGSTAKAVDYEMEYRWFSVGLDRADQIIEDTLNKHGRHGWELIAVYESGFRMFVLKLAVSAIGRNSPTTIEAPTVTYAPAACS
jgi:hypothetical protein